MHSDNAIRARILKDTPLGSTKSDVLAYVRESCHIQDEKISHWIRGNGPITGLTATIGTYPTWWAMGFETGVWAEWTFDKNNHLIAVKVQREVDAP